MVKRSVFASGLAMEPRMEAPSLSISSTRTCRVTKHTAPTSIDWDPDGRQQGQVCESFDNTRQNVRPIEGIGWRNNATVVVDVVRSTTQEVK